MKNAIIVGLGKQASKHITALFKFNGYKILGIDPNKTARLSFQEKFKIDTYSNFSELPSFTRENIELAIICSPVKGRMLIIDGLVEVGVRDFVIEKPLCLTIQECEHFVKLEQTKLCRFFVNFTYRVSTPFYQIKKLDIIDSLAIDYGYFYLGGRGSHQEWKHKIDSAGGVHNEMAIHMLDLANFFFGNSQNSKVCLEELLRPRRTFGGSVKKVDAPDLFVELKHFPSATALIVSDFLSPNFSNSVHLTSEREQLDLKIGEENKTLSDRFSKIFDIDEFGNDSYARLYSLVFDGDKANVIHRPTDTLKILRK